MLCSVICPTCRCVCNVPDDAIGTPIQCANCSLLFLPSAAVPVYGGQPGRPFPWPGETDAPGVIGLIFGAVAMVCFLMGWITCGVTWYAVVPLAGVGGGAAFFGRGNMKVAGIVLNLLALVPVLILMGLSALHH